MNSYISGKIVGKSTNGIVIENNGIGYDIGVSGNTLYDVDTGEIAKIYTYLYVREDEMSLYGFSREEEKKLFLRLIDISGIGPKMAMQILGGYDLKTLTVAIASGDVKTLCKIKGLGKKTAELIVLNRKLRRKFCRRNSGRRRSGRRFRARVVGNFQDRRGARGQRSAEVRERRREYYCLLP